MGETPFDLATKKQLITLVEKKPVLYDPNMAESTKYDEKVMIWAEIGKKLNLTGEICKKEWIKLKRTYDYSKISYSKRLSANSELFPLMKFLDIRKQQYPSSSGNQQQNDVCQQQRIENNVESGYNKGFRPEAARTGAVGETSTGQQTASLQVNVNVGSNNHNDNPHRNLDNSPMPPPKPSPIKVVPKKKKLSTQGERTNEKQDTQEEKQEYKKENKSENELDLFCRQIRAGLEELPRALQLEAQKELFNKLTEIKAKALQTL
ncbi:hypothetical protein PYW07_002442 [Mythimna separata]|uniref:MADF domain-containing protein n=1 Tax=Mythimna separata TaxID=271217 RepID=A0AAD7YMA4_MYTSE|nr:hypothetical protein PYW07_002442 [Mythimna separata]